MEPLLSTRASITGWSFIVLLIFAVVSGDKYCWGQLIQHLGRQAIVYAVIGIVSSPVIGWTIGTVTIAILRLYYRLTLSKPGNEFLTQAAVDFRTRVANQYPKREDVSKNFKPSPLTRENVLCMSPDAIFTVYSYACFPDAVVEYMRRLTVPIMVGANFITASAIASLIGFHLGGWSLGFWGVCYATLVVLLCSVFIIRAVSVRGDFENAQRLALSFIGKERILFPLKGYLPARGGADVRPSNEPPSAPEF